MRFHGSAKNSLGLSKNMVEAGSRQTGNSRHANDEETFVALPPIAREML